MAKLKVIVGDKTVWQGEVNSVRIYSDTFSLRAAADILIEADAEPVE
jgi:hypothetical protein